MKEFITIDLGKESPGQLRCDRCGEVYTPTLPLSAETFLRTLSAFIDQHEACQGESDEQNTQSEVAHCALLRK